MKLRVHLVKKSMSTSDNKHVNVRPTKTMNRADNNWAHFSKMKYFKIKFDLRMTWIPLWKCFISRHQFELDIVFCCQNCSDIPWEKIVLGIEKKTLEFEAEGWEFSKFLRSLEQFIQTLKGQNSFLYQNAFLTCSWRFFMSYKWIGKNYWDLEKCKKS